jgi:glycosyltransferase involved in cell wall biosynthesis
MRILTVLTYYYPHWTGLTAHAVSVAEGLAARGHEVTVLTARHDPHLAARETVGGVDIVRLNPIGRFSRGVVTPTFPFAAAKLISQHDVVQIHTPLPEAAIVALLCKTARVPLVMTHHGDVVMPAGAKNQLIQRVAFQVLSLSGRLANRVTTYSLDYASHSRLLGQFRDKLTPVFPPVGDVTPTPSGVAALRQELGLEGRRVIGFAGRWTDEKGFDYLLEALPIVREEMPEAHLVFAGEERIVYEDTFDRCAPLVEAQRDNITLMGLIRDPQRMADFYGMCDVFVLPSRTDMLALVQVEAMLAGTPVVASDIPGARVVVRETGFGRLVEPHNPPALASGILEVLRNPGAYAPTVEGVRRVFDTERTLDQYEETLTTAVSSSTRESKNR